MLKHTLMLAAVFAAGAPLGVVAQNTPTTVRDLASACSICHGTHGAAAPVTGGVPALAGESADTMAQRMKEFRDGKRPATIMHQIAKGYSDSQIDAITAYFAAQKK